MMVNNANPGLQVTYAIFLPPNMIAIMMCPGYLCWMMLPLYSNACVGGIQKMVVHLFWSGRPFSTRICQEECLAPPCQSPSVMTPSSHRPTNYEYNYYESIHTAFLILVLPLIKKEGSFGVCL